MRVLRQLWFLITRRRQEDDLAEELEFHRQMKADELRASGVSDRDLRRGHATRARQRPAGARAIARRVGVAVAPGHLAGRPVRRAHVGQGSALHVRRGHRARSRHRHQQLGVHDHEHRAVPRAAVPGCASADRSRLVDARGRGAARCRTPTSSTGSRSATSFEGLMADASTTMNVSDGWSVRRSACAAPT